MTHADESIVNQRELVIMDMETLASTLITSLKVWMRNPAI
jgi:hypothetical protein